MMSNARDRIKVELHQEQLWQLFREQQTEMVITRAGRRMFPILDFRLTGLDPEEYFSLMVQVVSADNYRYRYDLENATWTVTGTAVQPDPQRCINIHPHGSALGSTWLKEGAKFDKLKLTNHIKPCCDHIVLSSLQKYKIQLVVTKFSRPQCERWIFDFPETEFISVTCYQNPAITKLKIDYNPFAKSFRKGKRPAKQTPVKQESQTPVKQAKRPRIRLMSPPPIVRYQSPFINQVRGIPIPPLTNVCTQVPVARDTVVPSPPQITQPAARTVPQATLLVDSYMWEPSLPMMPQCLYAPPMSSNSRIDFMGSLCKPDYLATCQSLPYSHVTTESACSGTLSQAPFSSAPGVGQVTYPAGQATWPLSGGLFDDVFQYGCDSGYYRAS